MSKSRVNVLEAVSGSVTDAKEGRFNICVIKPGWGSSGYYPEEVLKRDGPNTWPAGTQSYLNHESLDEMFTRPERTVQEICGYLATPAEWVEDGSEGAGLYAELNVFPSQVDFIKERMSHVGMSIRAYAEGEYGEMEGRYGHIVTSFTEGLSVDVVTVAGAGGAIVGVIESGNTFNTDDRRFMLNWIKDLRERGEQRGLTDSDRKLVEALAHKDFPVSQIAENKKGFIMAELSEETGKALIAALEGHTAALTQQTAAMTATESKGKGSVEPQAPSALAIGQALASSGLNEAAQKMVIEAVENGADLAAKITEMQAIVGVKPGVPAAPAASPAFSGVGVVTESVGGGVDVTKEYHEAAAAWGRAGLYAVGGKR